MSTPEEKQCSYILCPHTFIPKTYNQKYCSHHHYSTCQKCGKQFEISKDKMKRIPKTCSNSCASSISHNDASKAKRRENSLKKYGTEYHKPLLNKH